MTLEALTNFETLNSLSAHHGLFECVLLVSSPQYCLAVHGALVHHARKLRFSDNFQICTSGKPTFSDVGTCCDDETTDLRVKMYGNQTHHARLTRSTLHCRTTLSAPDRHGSWRQIKIITCDSHIGIRASAQRAGQQMYDFIFTFFHPEGRPTHATNTRFSWC